MQRRKLDGNAGTAIDAAPGRCLADGVDGVFVVLVITLRILRGGRGFTQHVVGILEALFFQRLRTLDCLTDRFAGHELFAHHAHRHIDAATDDGFASSCYQLGQRRRKAAVVYRRGQLAGDDETPGGGVDEKRAPAANVGLPVAAGDLVADQRIAGGGVWNAQQRFGKAHQGHALMAGKRIFLHQPFDPRALGLGAQCLDQLGSRGANGARLLGRDGRSPDQRRKAFFLGAAIGGGNRLAQQALFAHRRRKILENTVHCYTGVACTIGHSEDPEKALKTDRRRQRVLRPPLFILAGTIPLSRKLLWPYFWIKTGNMNFYCSI